MGYGLGMSRLAQKEIAEELGRVLDGEDEIREVLKRAGITDLDALCMCSEKNLIDLRVSQSFSSPSSSRSWSSTASSCARRSH